MSNIAPSYKLGDDRRLIDVRNAKVKMQGGVASPTMSRWHYQHSNQLIRRQIN